MEITGMIIIASIVLVISLLVHKCKVEKTRARKLQTVDNTIISLFRLKSEVLNIKDAAHSALIISRINSFIIDKENSDLFCVCIKYEYEKVISSSKVSKYMRNDVELEDIADKRVNSLEYINYLIYQLDKLRKQIIYS